MVAFFYVSLLAVFQSACSMEYRAYGSIKTLALQHVFHTTSAATDMDCCNVCSMNTPCVAVNYEKSTGTCELNDKHPQMEAAGVKKVVSTSKSVYFLTAGCRDPWSAFRGHCYLYNSTALSWPGAEDHCVSLGGHLVDIVDGEENRFVGQFVSNDTWIGMTDLWTDHHRHWSTGRLVEYNNFKENNPDCWGQAENCVEMTGNKKWNDNRCLKSSPSMCKKPCYVI